MAYLKCYNVQPHQFKLTHDISIENFAALDDATLDEDLVQDSLKLFHIDIQNNGNIPEETPELNECENEDDIKKSKSKLTRNNSRTSSTFSLNLKNASLSSSFSESITDKDIQNAKEEIMKRSQALRIEEVAKLCEAKFLLKSESSFVRDGNDLRPVSPEIYDSDEDIDGSYVPFAFSPAPPKKEYASAASNCNYRQTRSNGESSQWHHTYGHDVGAAEAAVSTQSPAPPTEASPASASPKKKPRRPRKLPEIPLNVPKRIPAGAKEPLALSALMQNVSLADELHEAELVHEGHFPLTSSPRPADSLVLLRPKGPCPSNRHSFINLEELGSPDQVDPLHKQQLDESLTNFDNCDKSCCGYDSRGTQSQMELSIHEELVQCQQEEEAEPAEMAPVIDRTLSDTLGNMDFNAQSLPPRSTYMCQDSSPPELKSKVHQSSSPSGGSSHSDHSMRQNGKDDSKESTASTRSPSISSTFSVCPELEDYEPTHRGCHKFIPRHDDEIFVEIGDPIYVEVEADDLWCEGLNLRTGRRGIFPAAYATDLDLLEEGFDGERPSRFRLRFLGSVEVNYHKGTDVLCQAIHKIVMNRRMSINPAPAPLVLLEINEYGIKMTDKSRKKKKKESTPSPKKSSVAKRLAALLSKVQKEREANSKNNDHFFTLKNVSFCGYHPKNDKYFAFITKHPLDLRFACHVFQAEKTTKPVAEAVGEAFRRFYQEYMAFMHPTEDIYME